MPKWLKKSDESATKATTRESYLESTFQPISGRGGAVKKPENYTGYLQRFTSWVYAAAQTNARGVAAQTLRLYAIRPENATKSLYKTRQLEFAERLYLAGKLEHRPSKHVTSNAAAGGVNVEEVVEHPILDVLNNPSPDMDGYSLTVLRLLNLQLTGNSYLHPIISETLGVPVELYSMPSNLVEIVADTTFDNLVAGYIYGMPNSTNEFEPNEVLHQRQPNPLDMYYGKGWVSAAIEAIDLLESMGNYESNLLANEARPDWAVMVKDNMTDSQFQRLENSIKKKLRGNDKRGAPFIFEGGMDAKTLSFSPRDLAFSEGENRKVEVIAAISGVPVSKLKANDPNLASAREGNLGWLRDTILPYLVLDEQFLNRQLVPMFGQYSEGLFLAYDNPVPQDEAALASVAASDIAAGIRTRNEVRAERGLPPIEGGDEIMIPAGTMPIEIAIEQAKNPPMAMPFGAFGLNAPAETEQTESPIVEDGQPEEVDPAEALNGAQVTAALEIVELVATGQLPRETAIGQLMMFFNISEEAAERIMGEVGAGFVPSPIDQERALDFDSKTLESILRDMKELEPMPCDCCKTTTTAPISHKALCNPEFGAKADPIDRGNLEYEELLRKNREAMAKLELELRKIFDQQLSVLVESGLDLEKAIREGSVGLQETLGDFVEDVVQQSGKEAFAELGLDAVSFSMQSEQLQQFVRTYTIRLQRGLQNTTYDQLSKIIGRGAVEGLSTEEVSQRILDLTGGEVTAARASMIARTEIATLHEESRLQAWEQSGLVRGKQWVLAAGACGFCTALSLKYPDPIELTQNFYSLNDTAKSTSGETMNINYRNISTAPLHPNCRCGTIEVMVDEPNE